MSESNSGWWVMGTALAAFAGAFVWTNRQDKTGENPARKYPLKLARIDAGGVQTTEYGRPEDYRKLVEKATRWTARSKFNSAKIINMETRTAEHFGRGEYSAGHQVNPTGNADLHARIARALGWPIKDVQSFSLQSLRDLVRPVDPDLANEITSTIKDGSYIRNPSTYVLRLDKDQWYVESSHALWAEPIRVTHRWKVESIRDPYMRRQDGLDLSYRGEGVYFGPSEITVVTGGGNKQADVVLQEPVTPPKTKMQTRWKDGVWEKLTKKGWVAA